MAKCKILTTKRSLHKTRKEAYEFVSGLYHLASNGALEIIKINIYEDIESDLWIVERTIDYVEEN